MRRGMPAGPRRRHWVRNSFIVILLALVALATISVVISIRHRPIAVLSRENRELRATLESLQAQAETRWDSLALDLPEIELYRWASTLWPPTRVVADSGAANDSAFSRSLADSDLERIATLIGQSRTRAEVDRERRLRDRLRQVAFEARWTRDSLTVERLRVERAALKESTRAIDAAKIVSYIRNFAAGDADSSFQRLRPQPLCVPVQAVVHPDSD
jgi:hypothetical protein